MKKLFAGIFTIGMFGCVTSKPMTYMQDHSEAYNIAHAAGLYTDINNSYVPPRIWIQLPKPCLTQDLS